MKRRRALASLLGPAYDKRQEPYDVLLIAHDGSAQVFNSYFKQKERS